MTALPPSARVGALDPDRGDDRTLDNERFRTVRFDLNALVQRLDRLWFDNIEIRDGRSSAGTAETRRLLHLALAALDTVGP